MHFNETLHDRKLEPLENRFEIRDEIKISLTLLMLLDNQAARHSMSADLYFTSVSSFFLSSFFFFRNSTKIGDMVGSKCNLKTHVRNLGYPSPTNRGPKTTFFVRLRNLTATLTAYIFGMKHDIDNRSSALTTTRISYIMPKCRELWSTNSFDNLDT